MNAARREALRVERGRSGRRLVLYSPDTMGLGHQRRNLLIAPRFGAALSEGGGVWDSASRSSSLRRGLSAVLSGVLRSVLHGLLAGGSRAW